MWQLELNKHSICGPIRRELHRRSAAMIMLPPLILPELCLGGCSIFFFSSCTRGIGGPEAWRGPVGQENTTRTWQDWGSSSQATGLHIFGHSSTVLTEELWAFFPFASLNSTFLSRECFGFLPFIFVTLSGSVGLLKTPWWWRQHASLPENHSPCDIFSEHPFTHLSQSPTSMLNSPPLQHLFLS